MGLEDLGLIVPDCTQPAMPAHRAAAMHVTRTGLVIGSAYTPPVPPPGYGMSAVQRALLTPIPNQPTLLERLVRSVAERIKARTA